MKDVYYGCFILIFECYAIVRLHNTKKYIKNPIAFSLIYGTLCAFANYLLVEVAESRFTMVFPLFALLILYFFMDTEFLSFFAAVLLFYSAPLQLAALAGNLNYSFISNVIIVNQLQRMLPRIFNVGLYFFLKRYHISTDKNVPPIYCYPSIIVSSMGIIFIVQYYDKFAVAEDLLSAVGIMLLIISLLTYYMFYYVIFEYSKRMDMQNMNMRMDIMIKHKDEIDSLYQDARNLRHDLRNHMLVMESLIDDGYYEKLKDYFRSVKTQYKSVERFIDTGNVSLNALLNPKAVYAENMGICMKYKVVLPSIVNIDEADLIVVISNLLDNALEAVKKMVSPEIILEIVQKQSYLSITVQNSIYESIMLKNPNFVTTKEEKFNHGIGLRIVKKIAEKYNGFVHFEEKDFKLYVTVLLSNSYILK